jgi:hypothetical protein
MKNKSNQSSLCGSGSWRAAVGLQNVRMLFVFIYLTLILPGKLTESTFSSTVRTWGIVTGDRRGDE